MKHLLLAAGIVASISSISHSTPSAPLTSDEIALVNQNVSADERKTCEAEPDKARCLRTRLYIWRARQAEAEGKDFKDFPKLPPKGPRGIDALYANSDEKLFLLDIAMAQGIRGSAYA